MIRRALRSLALWSLGLALVALEGLLLTAGFGLLFAGVYHP